MILRGLGLGAAGVCLWLLLPACNGNGGSDGDACIEGDAGCACYGNKTCNGDLECVASKCEERGASSGGSGGQASSTAQNNSGAGATASGGAAGQASSGEASGSGGASTTSSSGGAATNGTLPAGTPVSSYGKLRVEGRQLVSEAGTAVQLKGISSMWLNWDPAGYSQNLEGLIWMRDHWQLKVIRAAMGVDAEGAYLEDPETAKSQVSTIIDNAIEAGVYVIVDWHDHDGELHQAEAEAFFDEISASYGDVPNVLYEVYNEPLDVSWQSVLKPYHEAVTAVIRANDPDNVIILGTPNWSQDVDVAAQSPISGTNLMYTLHFYACTHGAALREQARVAYDAGLPLFVTEWGATHADGGVDGIVCEADAQAWHDWLDQRGISWAAWKFDGCEDSSCLFKDRTAPVAGGWDESHLNGHAPFVIERLLAENPYLDQEPVEDPDGCQPTGACATLDGMDCSEGELVERDCSGCALLSCGVSCCASIGHFGADTVPDFLIREELITGFTQSATSASIAAAFDAPSQMAAVAFAFDQAYDIDPYYVMVSVDAAGDDVIPASDITVSLESGDAGCQYPIAYSSGTSAYLDVYPTCWNGFTTTSPVSQINVRLTSFAAGNAEMTVYGLAF